MLYLSPSAKYSWWKVAYSWRPLEWTKIKCKYGNQKCIEQFVLDGNGNMCYISLMVNVVANQIKIQKFDLQNEDEEIEKCELCHRTANDIYKYIYKYIYIYI